MTKVEIGSGYRRVRFPDSEGGSVLKIVKVFYTENGKPDRWEEINLIGDNEHALLVLYTHIERAFACPIIEVKEW